VLGLDTFGHARFSKVAQKCLVSISKHALLYPVCTGSTGNPTCGLPRMCTGKGRAKAARAQPYIAKVCKVNRRP
jgi:hypothetical protein